MATAALRPKKVTKSASQQKAQQRHAAHVGSGKQTHKKTQAQIRAQKKRQAAATKAAAQAAAARQATAARAAAHPVWARRKAKIAAEEAMVRSLARAAPLDVNQLPCGAAVAVLEARRLQLGVPWAAGDAAALWDESGPRILDVALAAGAWCEPARGISEGLVLGLTLPDGRPHAAVAVRGGWLSWGQVIAPAGRVEESWRLTWPAVV